MWSDLPTRKALIDVDAVNGWAKVGSIPHKHTEIWQRLKGKLIESKIRSNTKNHGLLNNASYIPLKRSILKSEIPDINEPKQNLLSCFPKLYSFKQSKKSLVKKNRTPKLKFILDSKANPIIKIINGSPIDAVGDSLTINSLLSSQPKEIQVKAMCTSKNVCSLSKKSKEFPTVNEFFANIDLSETSSSPFSNLADVEILTETRNMNRSNFPIMDSATKTDPIVYNDFGPEITDPTQPFLNSETYSDANDENGQTTLVVNDFEIGQITNGLGNMGFLIDESHTQMQPVYNEFGNATIPITTENFENIQPPTLDPVGSRIAGSQLHQIMTQTQSPPKPKSTSPFSGSSKMEILEQKKTVRTSIRELKKKKDIPIYGTNTEYLRGRALNEAMARTFSKPRPSEPSCHLGNIITPYESTHRMCRFNPQFSKYVTSSLFFNRRQTCHTYDSCFHKPMCPMNPLNSTVYIRTTTC